MSKLGIYIISSGPLLKPWESRKGLLESTTVQLTFASKAFFLKGKSVFFFFFFKLETGLTVYPWVAWNLLYRPGQPTQKDSPASASRVLELKVYPTPPAWHFIF